MYSTDFRYHWLLNDEKWWVDDFHWSKMSVWHRPQLSLVMKKLAGMMPRTFVSGAEVRAVGPTLRSGVGIQIDASQPHDAQHEAERHVEDDVGEVEQRRAVDGGQVRAVEEQKNQAREQRRRRARGPGHKR